MIKSLKISQKINQELKDIGIDMLPIHVEKECPCPTCCCDKDKCSCDDFCDSCGA